MDIHHLQHFLAVVETGSFHAAAGRLNLTQQAVSRSIKSLEAELGVRLVERRARDRRRVGPTQFGQLLLPHAKTVAKDMQALRDQFHDLLGHRHTLVRFAATPTAMRRLVAPALPRFHEQRPKLRVQAMTAVLPSILMRLAEGAFDFVVADEPPEPRDDTFDVEPLLQDRCVIVCGARHALARQRGAAVEARVLAKHRWIGFGPFMPTLQGTRQLFEAAALEIPDRALETSSLDLTLAELRGGDCLAAMPAELVRAELDAGELVALPLQGGLGAPWNISVYRLAEQSRSTASEHFVDCLRQVAGRPVARPATTPRPAPDRGRRRRD
jgi:DNA-binding transcriptional LysR family regulator